MSTQQAAIPIILCFAGHDPSGGAGLQADIEAITAQGAHATSVVTSLTVQDTSNVSAIAPVSVEQLAQAAATLLADMPVAVCKIGLLGSADIARAVTEILAAHPDIPVVLDPILTAGGGTALADAALLRVIREELVPRTTVLTPNSNEVRQLTDNADVDAAARQLLERGCQHVLVTGSHEAGEDIVHRLYGQPATNFTYDRLPGEYHGSGCTLAASLAARLALGDNILTATKAALDYTYGCLQRARPLGKGQWIPSRWPI